MIHSLKHTLFALFAVLALATSVQAKDEISAQDFVDQASAAGMAEVEAGKLALEKGTSSKVKEFARMMVDEHTAANQQLKALASKHDLEVADAPGLSEQAKAKILEMRDSDSFDKAYANNQVESHKAAVELFQTAANSEDEAIRAFAVKTLPKLEEHLKMAQQLADDLVAKQ
ncbi:DUF4142 domain-containing protein [Pseudomonas sp. BN414]|uniref:DUF4142 domain-containing protein n=1 Tax=Pseudomonas sp. BN414 TaxID=2567888 RepID=UPI0024567DD6|nr:DUF4142 domain-containing protein [Pseudomonas sp. BN414]MDH4567588.1 DUF4142 domain-containing protein [Pseudomonas sp. BN414]